MALTLLELDQCWQKIPTASGIHGRVIQVCVRPEMDQRAFPEVLQLSPDRGAIGDRWERRTWKYLPDGRPDPRVQVALMNIRMLEFVQSLTGSRHHPGDTLIVDFDLSEDNLPTGAHLQIGSAVVEISNVVNDACAKFARHYGEDVFAWFRDSSRRAWRLRGAFGRVVVEGEVRAGDPVTIRDRPTHAEKTPDIGRTEPHAL